MGIASFRFFITDEFDGCVRGTDDEALAKNLSSVQEYFVVDTELNCLVRPYGNVSIPEWKSPPESSK